MEYENSMMNHYHGTEDYNEQQNYEQSKDGALFMIIVLLGLSFLGICSNFFSSSNNTTISDINVELIKKINSSVELYDEEKYCEKGCVICLDAFKKDEKISKLECNHIYHTECIKLWFTNNLSCPMCRRIII